MATKSSAAKNKPDNKSLTKPRSLGPKPKPVTSSEPETKAEGPGRKRVEKPLPNYLKPTVSSKPDPVKFSRKKKAVEDDNQKLIRRRSFDRPLSSSSTHKSPNTPPPARPEGKHVTSLRSTSFHGSSRGGLRGSTTVKSPPLASRGRPGVKKSGLSGTISSKSRREGSENVQKKSLGKEITPEGSPHAPTHDDEEEIVKVETDVKVSDHIEDPKEEDKGQEVAQPYESAEDKENSELINEEQKEQENTQEEDEVVEKRVDVEEKSETVVTPDMKEAENVEETKEEIEAQVKEGTTETKKEVVKGKKGSPTAYNDVIASKLQESSRKNKVLALAGAFQTVIDYETAASK